MYPQSQENSPKLVNMAQPAVKRPWIRHHELGSHIHPHILKVYDPASNRHDRSQGPTTSATLAQASIFSASTQVPQPFGKPPQPASLHRHHEPTPSSPVYSLPHLRPPNQKRLLTRAWRLHYSCITTGYTRIGVSGFLGPLQSSIFTSAFENFQSLSYGGTWMGYLFIFTY